MVIEGLPAGDFDKLTQLARTEAAKRDLDGSLPKIQKDSKKGAA